MIDRKKDRETGRTATILGWKGHRKRLKERFRLHGLSSLHDYEALELLLFYAVPRKDVKPLAKGLILAFGGLRGVFDASFEDLKKIPGMGENASLLLPLVKALGSAYLKERALEGEQLSCTEDLVRYCMASMGGLKDERFTVIFLNTRNRIIEVEDIQDGTVNQAVVYPRKILEKALQHKASAMILVHNHVVYPRKILEKALQHKASAMILVHNHPSGNTAPSEADVRLTRAVQETAKILDIRIHDHLIIGGNRYFSFRGEGLLS